MHTQKKLHEVMALYMRSKTEAKQLKFRTVLQLPTPKQHPFLDKPIRRISSNFKLKMLRETIC